MKHLKLYEDYYNDEYSELKEWAYEYAKTNHYGLNSYEDAVEELDIFFDHDFPYFKGNFVLYRVIQGYNKDEIDVDDIGDHYIDPKYVDRLYDKNFYESIGINLDSSGKLFLLKVEANYNIVDWEETIHNRLNYPREFEITLKGNPILIYVEDFDKELIN